jgi:peptide/nickel transport system permease protein
MSALIDSSDLVEEPAPVRGSGWGTVRLVASKVAGAVFVLWGTMTVTFVVLAILPGDRATILLNVRTGQTIPRGAEELAPINERFGFDNPLVVQYLDYVTGLFRGDLGLSYQSERPVSTIVGEQIAPTFTLAIASLLLAWVLTVTWTLLTAGRGPQLRSVGAALETVLAGLPHYWIGILLLIVFAANLGWFPVISGDSAAGTVLPVVTLAVPLAGFLGQATRSEFDRAVREPFVLSARARGMGDLEVRARHVLRHALIPGITLSGWAIGSLISGAVLVETVFARPGLGAVLVTAVSQKDFAVVSGIVVLITLLYVIVNLVVDLVYLVVDPRLRGAR